ncbi:hypothetical protein EIN_273250 [Entamoeba invadens IP1]|uniref:Uncharacterized protein n=1 Tax=Entamoeba invadens IP1 TaxID=370355 RepID=A0A0A1U4K5_ENTIV|nr:hypothetical protein EIN_273250 [Entamoeba invadens IP1]ELP87808.1 hypothetical protein EIN_273250 [Entamoeba invadens IP1]|eukprot:XP_004254579.1 hypothetical protein EIN_273250 [Entamoeba invadens IP1]
MFHIKNRMRLPFSTTPLSLVLILSPMLLCFLISFQLFFHKETLFYSSSQRQFRSDDGLYYYTPPHYNDSSLDVRNFVYTGVCNKVFKYKPNNRRDLWLTAVGFRDELYWQNIKKDTRLAFGLSQSSIPSADRVSLLLEGLQFDEFYSAAKQYGVRVEVVKFTKDGQDATRRFLAYLDFLKKNKGKYDRVLISDQRDVFIFADFFSTFSQDDLIFAAECEYGGVNCIRFDEINNFKAIEQAYGVDEANRFKNNRSILINVGTVFGGVDRVEKYLERMVSNIDEKEWGRWYYDQALHNHVFYTYYYNNKLENITVETCTQRFCFREKNTIVYNKVRKTLKTKNTGCSPVLRHKIAAKGFYIDADWYKGKLNIIK